MSASGLLHELEAAGVRLHVAGDRLRAEIPPGADLGAFRDRITAHKPALLALLALQDEIAEAASAARDAFDRQHYDQLWERWHAFQVQEMP